MDGVGDGADNGDLEFTQSSLSIALLNETAFYFGDSHDPQDSDNNVLRHFGWDLPPPISAHPDLPGNDASANNSHPNFYQEASGSAAVSGGGAVAADGASLPPPPQRMAMSSSSSEDVAEKSGAATTAAAGGSTDKAPTETASKLKKKGQKRVRQQRFAFMTKSEVDHLEDGYRWRKYGQKAVKNSPFPRSYYRCTNSKCTVKKRVERSSEDPTVVITTYEGQHCHHTVGFPRSGNILMNHHDQHHHHHNHPHPRHPHPAEFSGHLAPPSASHLYYPRPQTVIEVRALHGSTVMPAIPTDEGLLGDMVPPGIRNS